MEENIIRDGTLYQIDPESGQLITLLNQRDYRMLGSQPLEEVVDDTIISLEFAEVVDGKVYCMLHYCRVEPGLGWRLEYVPQKSAMLMRDLESGDVSVLYTID
jgi:hypothetical protein